MRNFFEQQDHARRLTFRFATILALATVGTILVTGIALAALVTLLSIAHVRATTNIQLDQQYLLNEYLSRCWLGVGVSCTIVLGTALFKTFQLLDGGGWLWPGSWEGSRYCATRPTLNIGNWSTLWRS